MIRDALTALYTVIATALLLITLNCPAFAAEFEADLVMLPLNMSGKVYVKNNRINRQEMMGMVTIQKDEAVIQIFEQSKKYVVTDTGELEDEDPMAGIRDFESWIRHNDLKRTGTESIQGLKCDRYEGEIRDEDNGEPTRIKIWLSKKLDYPVKYEIFLPPPTGKMTSLLKNIKLGKLPASLFTVPKGYTKAASMEEAMGMQGLGSFMQNLGGKADSGGQQMPSEAQLNEMAEKFKQMLQQSQGQ